MMLVAIAATGALAALLAVGSGPSGAAPKAPYRLSPGSPVMVGPMAGRPSVGDMNGDRIPDVVVACGTCCGSRPDPKSGHVVVLLGDGKGEFRDAPGSPFKVASSVRKVALGDFNRDGRLDVAAAQHDSYDVVVFLGDGTGRLAQAPGSPVAASTGTRPHTHEIAAAEVNGDGRVDLLTTNANDNTISVLLGDGTGRFAPAPASPVAAGRHPYDAIAPCDVNGDGRVDLVVPNLAGSAIAVLVGDGTGGFSPAPGSPHRVGDRPGYVAVGDFDRDGDADVAATHDDVGMVDVLLGDGRGGFAPAAGSPVRLAAPVWGIAAHDLDGDGALDLALGAMGDAGPVVLRGDGKGGFAEAGSPVERVGSHAHYVVVADLDRDGRSDLVTGNYGSGDLSVYLGK
jgi:hypothetical protein